MEQKRRATRSPSLSRSLSSSLKAIIGSAKGTRPSKKYKHDIDELNMMIDSMTIGEVPRNQPMIVMAKKKQGRKIVEEPMDVVDMFANMQVKPRKVLKAKKPAAEPTRASTRRAETLPEIQLEGAKPHVVRFLAEMNAVVKKLNTFEKRMIELEKLLDKILTASREENQKKLVRVLSESGLEDVIAYITDEAEIGRVMEFKDRIATIQPKLEEYKIKSEEYLANTEGVSKEKKRKTEKNIRNIQLMMDKYINNYHQNLVPLVEKVLKKVSDFKEWKKGNRDLGQGTLDLFANLKL